HALRVARGCGAQEKARHPPGEGGRASRGGPYPRPSRQPRACGRRRAGGSRQAGRGRGGGEGGSEPARGGDGRGESPGRRARAPGAAIALASDFEHPASHDTSQQFTNANVQRLDKPNDPDYDNAEPGGNQPSKTNLYDERFDLFGFPSVLSPGAVYNDGPISF